jgi:hypothetical protein
MWQNTFCYIMLHSNCIWACRHTQTNTSAEEVDSKKRQVESGYYLGITIIKKHLNSFSVMLLHSQKMTFKRFLFSRCSSWLLWLKNVVYILMLILSGKKKKITKQWERERVKCYRACIKSISRSQDPWTFLFVPFFYDFTLQWRRGFYELTGFLFMVYFFFEKAYFLNVV